MITIKERGIGELTKKFMKPGFISIPSAVGESKGSDKKDTKASWIKGSSIRFALAAALGAATFSSAAMAHETPQPVPPKAYLVIDNYKGITAIEQDSIDSCLENIVQMAKSGDHFEATLEKWGEMVEGKRYHDSGYYYLTCFSR